MNAALIFTQSGPVLILTSRNSLTDPDVVSRLAAKGITKYIAHQVPVQDVERWYGPIFDRVVTDRTQDDALRILDIDGGHIFGHLRLSDLGPAVRWEAEIQASRS